MKVNIYYGGRGLIEDPTIYVINKLAAVLKEIRVEVTRYNLYEEKNGISMLPKTLKEADGIILATHVEWMGIGGLMQEFLDACWLYGDKEKIASLYMMPVVIAGTYGEREAEQTLWKAWELLGGISCDSLCAYVENHVEFETNPDYAEFIEKKAESLYRSINQKQINLPSSNNAVKATMLRTNTIDLTPQESEQLSIYVSDDTYVKKQKEDIEELTKIFKEMLDGDEDGIESKSTVQNTQTYKEPAQNIPAPKASVPRKTVENGGNPEVDKKVQTSKLKEELKTKVDAIATKPVEEKPKQAAYIPNFKKNFKPIKDLHASYAIQITDMNQTLVVEADTEQLKCYYGDKEDADVTAKTSKSVMDQLIQGRITFQNAFMSGVLTAKGNFKTLRIFDTIFQFNIL